MSKKRSGPNPLSFGSISAVILLASIGVLHGGEALAGPDEEAQQILEATGVTGGLIVHVGRVTSAKVSYRPEEVSQVQERAVLRSTGSGTHLRDDDGRVRLTVRVAANGASFLILRPGSQEGS